MGASKTRRKSYHIDVPGATDWYKVTDERDITNELRH